VFAVNGTDPLLTLFAWLSNLATLCILILMAMTSAAVVMFYRRGVNNSNVGKVRTLVLPIIAGIGLAAVLVLAILNFHVLTGASRLTSFGLIGMIPPAMIAGLIAARRLRKADPERFACLGQDRN
jgi:hypothetical protein